MREPIVHHLYEELKQHVGKQHAISADELCRKFGIDERKLRDHIREIRRDSEAELVVSSSNKGYFICTTEEMAKANERLYRQAKSLMKTVHANEKKIGKTGQMKMLLEDFIKDTGEA